MRKRKVAPGPNPGIRIPRSEHIPRETALRLLTVDPHGWERQPVKGAIVRLVQGSATDADTQEARERIRAAGALRVVGGAKKTAPTAPTAEREHHAAETPRDAALALANASSVPDKGALIALLETIFTEVGL